MTTKKRTNRSANPTEIAPNTRVNGRIAGEDDLVVLGHVLGRIEITGTVEVAPGGIVEADVEATAMIISGVVVGDVTVSESLIIEATGRVVGQLSAPTLRIVEGAQYAGVLAISGARSASTPEVETIVEEVREPSVDLPAPVELDLARRDRDRPMKRVVVKKRVS